MPRCWFEENRVLVTSPYTVSRCGFTKIPFYNSCQLDALLLKISAFYILPAIIKTAVKTVVKTVEEKCTSSHQWLCFVLPGGLVYTTRAGVYHSKCLVSPFLAIVDGSEKYCDTSS